MTRFVTICIAGLAACGALAGAQRPIRAQCPADSTSGTESVRLYLSPIRVDSGYRLTPYSYSGATHVEQNIDFAEHADSAPSAQVVGVATRTIDTRNAVQFVSPPLAGPFDLSGFFSGRLELITNKPDFDFQLALYELTSAGDFILSSSYTTQSPRADNLKHHAPLQTGIRQYRDFESACFARRVVQNGSRLVVLIRTFRPTPSADPSVRRYADSASTVGDNEPLKVGWYGDSYVELRVRHH